MKALTEDIHTDESEIEACKWLDVSQSVNLNCENLYILILVSKCTNLRECRHR